MAVENLKGMQVSALEVENVASARKFARGLVQESFFQEAIALVAEQPTAYPRELVKKVASYGLTSIEIDNEYLPDNLKGAKMSPAEQAVVMEELARKHAGLALSILVLNSLTAFELNKFGTEKQKVALLPKMATGELVACFGLTEPDVGSDAKNIQLKATPIEEGKFRIETGHKRFITGANGADIMFLAARTGSSESRGDGITFFIVDMHDPGISVQQYSKAGQPGSPLCEVVFDNVILSSEHILGGPDNLNKGWPMIDATLKHSRNWIAAQGVGLAQRVYDEAVKYGMTRMVHGKYLTDLPDHATALRVMDTQVDLSRRLVQLAAEKEMSGDKNFWVLSSLSKLIACDTAAWAALEAMQLHGGIGYTNEMEICKLWLDSPVLRIYEGTVPIQIKLVRSGGITNGVIRGLLPPKLSESYVSEELDVVHPELIEVALSQLQLK